LDLPSRNFGRISTHHCAVKHCHTPTYTGTFRSGSRRLPRSRGLFALRFTDVTSLFRGLSPTPPPRYVTQDFTTTHLPLPAPHYYTISRHFTYTAHLTHSCTCHTRIHTHRAPLRGTQHYLHATFTRHKKYINVCIKSSIYKIRLSSTHHNSDGGDDDRRDRLFFFFVGGVNNMNTALHYAYTTPLRYTTPHAHTRAHTPHAQIGAAHRCHAAFTRARR